MGNESERDKKIEWTCNAMAPFLDQLPDTNARLTVAIHLVKQAIFNKAMSRVPIGSSVFKDVWRYYCGQAIGMLTSYPENGIMDDDLRKMKVVLEGEPHVTEECGCILCQLGRDIKQAIKEREAAAQTEKSAKPTAN